MTSISSMAEYLSLRRLGLSNHAISNDAPLTAACLCGYSHHAACTFIGNASRFLCDNIWNEFLQKPRKRRKNYSR